MRLTLRRLADGALDMFLRVQRAGLPEVPALCSGDPLTTTLSTRLLSIDDGIKPVVEAPIIATWECQTTRLGTIRDLRLSASE